MALSIQYILELTAPRSGRAGGRPQTGQTPPYNPISGGKPTKSGQPQCYKHMRTSVAADDYASSKKSCPNIW